MGDETVDINMGHVKLAIKCIILYVFAWVLIRGIDWLWQFPDYIKFPAVIFIGGLVCLIYFMVDEWFNSNIMTTR